MRFHVHTYHHPDKETAERLWRIEQMLSTTIGMLEMLDPAVQALVDAAKEATKIGPALDAGFKSLTAQVAMLSDQIAQTTSMSDDEKASLLQTAKDLSDQVATLKTDIPAGTS